MEYDNSNTVLKPIATQSIGTEVIPHAPMIVIASSQERSHYHAQDFLSIQFWLHWVIEPYSQSLQDSE